MNPLTREWVEKAEGDFLVAVQIMRRKKQRVYDAVCFHCQQAVEKYLKARLTEAGLACPRTHDLPALLILLLPVEPLWKSYETAAKSLTDYAVNFRYPGNSATLAEARKALKHCRSLRVEARRSLGLKN
ncbi:MAG TPA: HEPN domain-containing protein [Candidatus Sulfotelmatobacter sp.]|nr:HEPN domain-containing protein [Candidatus Sulfotelmatobacter sp.]